MGQPTVGLDQPHPSVQLLRLPLVETLEKRPLNISEAILVDR